MSPFFPPPATPSSQPSRQPSPQRPGSRRADPRYTLVFRNGELLRHQDLISLAQYRSDARLQDIVPEPSPEPWPALGSAA